VVDDNTSSRLLLDGWLRGWGMDATSVGDGMAAMDALWHGVATGRPIELVLVDARMPDTDGLALVARIRERAELAATRIVLLAAGEKPGDMARLRDLRVEAYLAKPVLQVELLETVAEVLGRSSEAAPALTPAAPAAAPAAATVRPAVRLRVLVAEDNEFNSRLVEEL